MSKEPFRFTDNTRVKAARKDVDGQYSCTEYLSVGFYEREDDGDDREVILSRYCVPGRCDTYSFTTLKMDTGPRHLGFFADGRWNTLAATISLVQKDLDKPQVVELLVAAVSKPEHRYYSRILNDILASIAPKSKACKACVKAFDKMMVEVTAQIEANKVKRLAEARELVARSENAKELRSAANPTQPATAS